MFAETQSTLRRTAVLFGIGALLVSAPSCRKSPTDSGGDGSVPDVSNFDNGTEGWTAFGDGILYHSPTGGNPASGGHIFIIDRVEGDVFYFEAPLKFRGDKAGAFGRSLAFSLTWSETQTSTDTIAPDVMIIGASDTLTIQLPQVPGSSWTDYSIPLDATGGWTLGDSETAASGTQILTVLSDIRRLRIRGEFRTGPEQGSLDNVQLGAID